MTIATMSFFGISIACVGRYIYREGSFKVIFMDAPSVLTLIASGA
jgi:hypothetical protein